jgi:hypothetical protein
MNKRRADVQARHKIIKSDIKEAYDHLTNEIIEKTENKIPKFLTAIARFLKRSQNYLVSGVLLEHLGDPDQSFVVLRYKGILQDSPIGPSQFIHALDILKEIIAKGWLRLKSDDMAITASDETQEESPERRRARNQ